MVFQISFSFLMEDIENDSISECHILIEPKINKMKTSLIQKINNQKEQKK